MRSRTSCQSTRIIGAIGWPLTGPELDIGVKSFYSVGGHVTAVTNSAPNSGALVVTGGGRGIGAQIALRAARHGTPVALIYRSRPGNAARVAGQIEAAGGRAVAIQADVGSESDVARAFTAVDTAFGSLGGLVNNAVL